ncbi:MAG: glycosyltransferase, partial [Candidatus Hydrothermae bacterium]|nr:glycosyltransferase [Candidatus Hydrothermae bacterium]
GYRQVMENGREGLFVRPEDPEALARAVIELLRHPEAMKGMGEAGREKAVSFYSWDRIAGEVESYYFEVLERNRRP